MREGFIKLRHILIGGILALVPQAIFASLGASSAEREVSGKVVDLDTRRGIVVLTEYRGWDRVQMEQARVVSKSATRRWLEAIDPKHAAIYLRQGDFAGLKKGDRIRIARYRYAFSGEGNGRGASVVPQYEKLEVFPK